MRQAFYAANTGQLLFHLCAQTTSTDRGLYPVKLHFLTVANEKDAADFFLFFIVDDRVS